MQVNQLRGLLYEFGVVLPQGRRPSIEAAKGAMASLADQLPTMLTDSLQDQLSRMLALDEQIQRIEPRTQPGVEVTKPAAASLRSRALVCLPPRLRWRLSATRRHSGQVANLRLILDWCRDRTARAAK
jgi:transposase